MRCMRYYVFRRDDDWAVKHGDKVCCAFASQAEAIHAAIETAHDFGDAFHGAEVLVEDEGGEYRTRWTYGQDPYPPRSEA